MVVHFGFSFEEATSGSGRAPIIFWLFINEDVLWIFERENCRSTRLKAPMRLKVVEKEAQCNLKRLRNVLETIKEIVMDTEKLIGRLSLCCVGGELKVYKRASDENMPRLLFSSYIISLRSCAFYPGKVQHKLESELKHTEPIELNRSEVDRLS